MQSIGINEFRKLNAEGVWIIDTRSSEIFCNGFMKGAVSVPFDENFKDVLSELVEDGQSLLLIADIENAEAVTKALKTSINYEFLGILSSPMDDWMLTSRETDLLITIDVEEFAIDYNYDEFFLIDVRDAEQYVEVHLEHAQNIELNDLEQTLTDMETADSYYICGRNFTEATTAGSVFKQNGFERVRVVQADFVEFENTKLPFVKKKKEKTDSRFLNN